MYDTDKSGQVNKSEFKTILSHMNSAVSYFGDDSMSATNVDEVADHIFEKYDHEHDGKLSYSGALAVHACATVHSDKQAYTSRWRILCPLTPSPPFPNQRLVPSEFMEAVAAHPHIVEFVTGRTRRLSVTKDDAK